VWEGVVLWCWSRCNGFNTLLWVWKGSTVIGFLELHVKTLYYIMRNAEMCTSHRHSIFFQGQCRQKAALDLWKLPMSDQETQRKNIMPSFCFFESWLPSPHIHYQNIWTELYLNKLFLLFYFAFQQCLALWFTFVRYLVWGLTGISHLIEVFIIFLALPGEWLNSQPHSMRNMSCQ
jgi:hypothetical protein